MSGEAQFSPDRGPTIYVVSTWPDASGVVHIVCMNVPPPELAEVRLDLRHGTRWEPTQLIAACMLLDRSADVRVVGNDAKLLRQTIVALTVYGIFASEGNADDPSASAIRVSTTDHSKLAPIHLTLSAEADVSLDNSIGDSTRVLVDLTDLDVVDTSHVESIIEFVRRAGLPVLLLRGTFDARTDLHALLSAEGIDVDADPRLTLGSVPRSHPQARVFDPPWASSTALPPDWA